MKIANGWPAVCQICSKITYFEFRCYAKASKYCSRDCTKIAKQSKPIRNQYGVYNPWTANDDLIITEEFPFSIHLDDLASKLNRTKLSIKERAYYLGLVKLPEIKSQSLALGGKKNKGNKRPDLIKNGYRGSGSANPFFGRTHTAETRKVISEKAKEMATFKRLAKDPEFQRKRMIGLHAKPNKPEIILQSILNNLFPKEYKYTGSGEFVIDGLCPDFTNVNGQKKVIELFGEQYHDPAKAPRPVNYRSTEKGRRESLAKFGWLMLVIWSQEIYKGGVAGRVKLEQKLRDFHENCSD